MLFPRRYSHMWFDAAGKEGGGGSSDDDDPDDKKPASKTSNSGSQTDYQRMYTELSQKITNGEYVTQESYAAQQAKYQKLFDDHQALTEKHETLQGQLSELQVNFDKASADLETASKTTEEKDAELNKVNQSLERLQLITKDFQQLLPFENEGLLPQVALEDLPEALEKFAGKLSALETANVTEELTGSTKKPSGKEELGERTAEVAKKEMNEAMGRGDIQEYEAKRAEYFKLLDVEPADPDKVIPE